MIVVDASVWVSHLVTQDVHHSASQTWLKNQISAGNELIAPGLLLAEVAGAIARRTGDPALGHKAVAHIVSIPKLRLVPSTNELSQLAANCAADHLLRGADALYVSIAHHLNVPLVSWDKEQLKRGSNLIITLAPTAE